MFPTVHVLADASEEEVLRAWEGLGYYSRARNLHACAKIISEKHYGHFPQSFEKLLDLPGIGPYTAAAIASFCFDEPVAVVDGNVFRVLARLFGISKDIRKSHKYFSEIANQLIPDDEPGEFNQAIMEFGALQCTPRSPDCDICPVNSKCYAFQNRMQQELPYKSSARPSKKRFLHYLVLQRDNSLLMRRRSGKDIWQNLYDFPVIENDHFMEEEELLVHSQSLLKSNLILEETSPDYTHQLSHQKLHVRFYRLRTDDHNEKHLAEGDNLQFTDIHNTPDLPKPVLISRYLNDHIF